ncbi:cytochrome P450 2C8 [Patella vulgata]|uniref:cytochrome P450 2C8 n=1 Tax=Patella vulgata TaxID=6465 RepID=UPI00217F70C9|nr:cytochrome P450 2C8 [Patella vulgata]
MFGFLLDGYVSIIVLLITFCLYLYWGTRRPPGLPPGPTPLPMIGNIPSLLATDTIAAFARLRDEYGDIFSLVIGNGVLVVVNGYDTIKEVLVQNGDLFSERPQNLGYTKATKGLGIISTNGVKWKEQRRFALSTLRDFGMGRVQMFDRITNECQKCLNNFAKQDGRHFDPDQVIGVSVCNVICNVVFGKGYAHDDPEFLTYLEMMHSDAKKVGNTAFMHFFPLLQFFVHRSLMKTDNAIRRGFIATQVQEHQQTFDENNLRDFVDVFLKQMEERESEEMPTFHYENLLQIVGEFFFAGTETTTTTLRWAILFLALHPEQQTVVQEEIDRVIGRDRKPTANDRRSLPLTEATILEVQRLGDVVPLSVPHAVAEETVINGYRIPTNAIILPNLSSVLNSKELWGDPEVFRPARFLDSETKLLKVDAHIPFSLGKRMCLGESLARMELYIFMTMMLQSFTFSLPDTEPIPCLRGVLGITRMPHPYNIIATKR